jgi:hypothetical protein
MTGEKIEINNGRGIDASRIHVSGYTAIGLMGSLFVAAFVLASLIRDTDNRITTLSKNTDNQIIQVSRQIADLVVAVDKISANTQDRFKKRDAAWACAMAALANPGFVCVNPLASPPPHLYVGLGQKDAAAWRATIERE